MTTDIEALKEERRRAYEVYSSLDAAYRSALFDIQKQRIATCENALKNAGVGVSVPAITGISIPLNEWRNNQASIMKKVLAELPGATFVVSQPYDGYPGYVKVEMQ